MTTGGLTEIFKRERKLKTAVECVGCLSAELLTLVDHTGPAIVIGAWPDTAAYARCGGHERHDEGSVTFAMYSASRRPAQMSSGRLYCIQPGLPNCRFSAHPSGIQPLWDALDRSYRTVLGKLRDLSLVRAPAIGGQPPHGRSLRTYS